MSESPKKKPGCGCLALFGLGVGVVALAGGGAYLYFSGFFGKELVPQEVARIIPQDALATSYISTDAEDWSKITKLGTPEAQKLLTQNLQNAQKELFKQEDNINYEKDIEPWLGGIMFAVLPPQTAGRTEQVTDSDNFVVIVGIKNKIKALEFASKQKKDTDQKTVETNYQGITISQSTDKNNNKYSWAFFDNYAVVAPTNAAIEKTIDTYKGKPSLAQKEGANNIYSQKLSIKDPLVQIHIPDYGGMVEQYASQLGSEQIPPATLNQLKQVGGMTIGVGLEGQSVRMQAIAKLNTNIQASLTPTNGKILAQLPANTIALISGNSVKDGWSQFVAQSQNDPQLQSIVTSMRQGSQSVNLDLDRDIFGWMDGEYAITLVDIGAVNLFQSDPGLGGAIVLETSDRQTGQQTLEKLQTLMSQQMSGYMTVESKNVGGVDITEWKVPTVGTIVSHGWLNNNSLAVTIKMPFENLQNIASTSTLNQSPNFKAVTASLPQSNLGYFYLDLEKVAAKVNSYAQAMGTPMPAETSAMLDSMQGFALTTTTIDATTSQVDAILSLKSTTGGGQVK